MSTMLDTSQADTRLEAHDGAEVPPPRRRWRPIAAAVLALVAVAAAGMLAWLLATGGPASSAGSVDHPDEREDVMSLATSSSCGWAATAPTCSTTPGRCLPTATRSAR